MFECFTNNKRKLVKQVRQNEKEARQALRLTWQGNERAYTTAILLYEPAVAVPLMVVIILLVSKKSAMGVFTAGRSIIILSCIATAVMGTAAVRMLIPG